MNRVGTRHPVDAVLVERGSTQKWLATKLRIDHTLLNHYLAGRRRPPPDLYRRIADVLQVPEAFLVPPRQDTAA